jgi:hypothetical protein
MRLPVLSFFVARGIPRKTSLEIREAVMILKIRITTPRIMSLKTSL